MGKTTITIDIETRKKLKLYQVENNFKTLDASIQNLLEQYGK